MATPVLILSSTNTASIGDQTITRPTSVSVERWLQLWTDIYSLSQSTLAELLLEARTEGYASAMRDYDLPPASAKATPP